MIGGLLVGFFGIAVALISNADDPPPVPLDCLAVTDSALQIVSDWGEAGQTALESLDDPDIEEQCGPVVGTVNDLNPADLPQPSGGTPTTIDPPTP